MATPPRCIITRMENENDKALNALKSTRDNLQKALDEAIKDRASFQLAARDRYREFTQKIGEISFLIGAALVPIVIASGPDKVSYLGFVLAGVGLYLLNGILALWHVKTMLERDSSDAPFIGLDSEIYTYPVIYAHNKLLFDLNDESYREEYKKVNLNFIEWARKNESSENRPRPKASYWMDVLLSGFVIASLLVARAVWMFGELAYWIVFIVVFLLISVLLRASSVKLHTNHKNLEEKQEKLARIRREYQVWHNETVFGKKR